MPSGTNSVSLLALSLLLSLPFLAMPAAAAEPDEEGWEYGGFVDVSYILNFNFPENHQWRSRTTTPRSNELAPNMVLGYIRKRPRTEDRWGIEFGIQGGYDSKEFAFGNDRPLVAGADTLRHFAYANVSYLVPCCRGLKITAGLFDSFIGYESLYARRNLNYSRSWIADNSPYKMFGIFTEYPLRDDLTLGVAVINGYWHLANPNSLPSYVTHLKWDTGKRLTIMENLYYGPDQQDTSLQFWRFFSNFIAEWSMGEKTVAFSYDIGTEESAENPRHPRTFWTGAALFTRWHLAGPWSVALRPELYWDRTGRMTGFEQFVKAITTTLEYRWTMMTLGTGLMRIEYRYDESTGRQGGFFINGTGPQGPRLAAGQHLLFLSLILSFDSPAVALGSRLP